MSDRGMKKWNAYRSLPEHDPAIKKTINEQYKVNKPIISSEEAELINAILMDYQGEELDIEYYRDGVIHSLEHQIVKIDPYNRQLILTDRSKIKFNEFVSLKRRK